MALNHTRFFEKLKISPTAAMTEAAGI